MNGDTGGTVESWAGLNPPYSTIVADPPWPYEERVVGPGHGRGLSVTSMPYSTMSLDEIAAMPIGDLAGAPANLYLWTTSRFLWDAHDIVSGWGFTPSQVLVWSKPPSGLNPNGGTFVNTAEFIILARFRPSISYGRRVGITALALREARTAAGLSRAQVHAAVRGGKLTGLVDNWELGYSIPTATDWAKLRAMFQTLPTHRTRLVCPERPEVNRPRIDRSVFDWPRGAHSVKPDAFFDVVERVSPGPYVELFARAPRLGWDHWGHGYESQTGAAS